MSDAMWMSGLAAVALLAYALWFFRLVRFVNAPSNGPKIPVGRDKQALLLVDMQAEHFEGARPEDETRLLAAVKTAIAEARRRGHPVIALRHGWQTAGTRLMARMMLGGKGLAWAAGTEIHPDLAARVDHVVTKHVQDGFENPELGALLDRLGIGRLRIAGLDGCYCVKKTALGAANRGYRVELLTDAILTARPQEWRAWLARLPERIVPTVPAAPAST